MTPFSIILIIIAGIIFAVLFGAARLKDRLDVQSKMKKIEKMQDDFAGLASHKVKTPITIIQGYLELLKSEENLSEKGIKNINLINDSAKKIDQTLHDVLDLSVLMNSVIPFQFETMDPVSIIHSFAEKRNITSQVFSTGNIHVDPFYFKRMLDKYVSYRQEGNASVSQKTKVHIILKKEGGSVRIIVEDQGKEITQEERQNHAGFMYVQKIVSKIKGTLKVEVHKINNNRINVCTFTFPLVV